MDKYLGKMLDNRYEILEIIGVGGMAVVYKAKCHRLNRLVALKILKDDYAQDADFKRRFHAESQAVAMLSHPNIVAVYDVSRSGNVEYIVMELIDGITLKQYMSKKGHLSWREVLHFSTQIAKALSHAHSRGIIHRDIKPHNIMILRDGSVKVADFGIARFSGKQNTLTQEALGSVHYISPEQARGSHIDARSDIYSVGVVMYEMLTMRLPYEGDSPVSVAIQHINSIPLTPREIDANIPEALETIAMKAMSASLSKRYASAEALLHDLEEFRKNPSISFDYDIAELMTKDEDEPTKKMSTVAPQRQGGGKARSEASSYDDETYRARQRNKQLTLITGLAFVLIFVVAMGYLVITLLGNLEGNGGPAANADNNTVEVPKLVGLVFDNIDNSDYPDFIIKLNPEGKNSDIVEAGKVLEQDPTDGKMVKKGTTITVTVSKGLYTFTMPIVNEEEYRSAQQMLIRDHGLNPEIEYETSDTIVKDYVIRTEPPAGVSVSAGDVVKIIVSKGPKVEYTTMPKLVGMMLGDAERELEIIDLLVSPTEVESDKPMGEIVWQSIPADTQVETKTMIEVQVSLGPAITPEPEPIDDVPETPTPTPTETPNENEDVPATGATTIDPTPTPTPTPQNQQVTVPITVSFPSESGVTQLEIKKNGLIYITEEVNNSIGQKPYQITGMPTDTIDVYFDGNLKFTQQLVP